MGRLVSDLLLMARTYARGGYPPFVYGGAPPAEHLPALFFHAVQPSRFEAQLAFLRDNGYETLSCDEATARQRGQGTRGRRDVLLTFDDGLASLHRDAYPLLSRYGFKAVAYILPAWVGQPGFVTWNQIREMHASGLVDIQSHSFAHASLVTHMAIAGVWSRRGPSHLGWDLPGVSPDMDLARFSRLPVLEGTSLFQARHAFILPRPFWEECLSAPDGDRREHLLRYRAILRRHRDQATEWTGSMIRGRMREDLEASRQALEEALPGHHVRHFAYPWHLHGPDAWSTLELTGFSSAAVGLESSSDDRRTTDSVLEILRVNGDFLTCLPGRGRESAWRVFARKARRRLAARP
jgi:hypothetical protein